MQVVLAGLFRFLGFACVAAALAACGGGGGGSSEDAVGTVEFFRIDSARGTPVPATLFLTGATLLTNNGAAVFSLLYERMRSRDYAGLTLEPMWLDGTHVSIDVPAFAEALRRYFPQR